jgi:hypothetical protein
MNYSTKDRLWATVYAGTLRKEFVELWLVETWRHNCILMSLGLLTKERADTTWQIRTRAGTSGGSGRSFGTHYERSGGTR